MNPLKFRQSKTILYFKNQIHGVAGLCVCMPFLFASAACTDGQITKEPDEHNQNQIAPLYTPNSAIGQGQLNALHDFISRKWQLSTINGETTKHPAIIDLSGFASGLGEASTDCGTIYFKLDTSGALLGTLATTHIERTLGDCSHDTEDKLMRILSDLYGFNHAGDVLTLHSLKDELKLIPAQ